METIFLNGCKERVLPWFNKMIALQTKDSGFDKLQNQVKVQAETIRNIAKTEIILQNKIYENGQSINN